MREVPIFMRQAYFLGGTTADGFRSRFFDRLSEPGMYSFILKGGPGTGKSTLMRRIAEAFGDETVSLYHCASDASSLDAVVLEDRHILVADGTAPHVMEVAQPMLTGEIVNLGALLNGEQLRGNQSEIAALFAENARLHKRARQYAQAVTSLHDDIRTAAQNALLCEKLTAFSGRMLRRLLPRANGKAGTLSFHQLSALTADGYITHALPGDYHIVLLKDPYFAGSDHLLHLFAQGAVMRGLNCLVSENYLFGEPQYEHLILPECKIALLTESTCTTPAGEFAQVLNFRRFYDKAELAKRRQRTAFGQKASRSLLEEAAESIRSALSVHDDLEAYYIDALDFTGADHAAEQILARIKARSKA